MGSPETCEKCGGVGRHVEGKRGFTRFPCPNATPTTPAPTDVDPDAPIKCGTFGGVTIPPHIRARMDADRDAAEATAPADARPMVVGGAFVKFDRPAPADDKRKMGLYGKFRVERTDGKSAPGQKHDGCDYFVLDLTHDPLAPDALRAYAAGARRAGYGPLADDLDAKVGPAPADDARIYPCADCGLMRSRSEGGTTFTVCDVCWDKAYPTAPAPDAGAAERALQALVEGLEMTDPALPVRRVLTSRVFTDAVAALRGTPRAKRGGDQPKAGHEAEGREGA